MRITNHERATAQGLRLVCSILSFHQEQVRAVSSRRLSEFPCILSVDVVTVGTDRREFRDVSFECLLPTTGITFEVLPRWPLAEGLHHRPFPKPRSSRVRNDHCIVKCAWRSADSSEKSTRVLASADNSEAGPFRPGAPRRWPFSPQAVHRRTTLQRFRHARACDSGARTP